MTPRRPCIVLDGTQREEQLLMFGGFKSEVLAAHILVALRTEACAVANIHSFEAFTFSNE